MGTNVFHTLWLYKSLRRIEREKHERECFVVLEEGADAATVEKEIKEMPKLFLRLQYNSSFHY